jgi:drug/metabolite transporter (DMT)-like permease
MRRYVTGRHQHDATTVAAVQVALAAAMMLVAAPFFVFEPVELDAAVVVAVLVLGILASGIAYIWNTVIVERWGATPASTVTYISPLVGVVLGVAVLGERLFWNQPVGAVVVVVGILVSQGVIGKRRNNRKAGDDVGDTDRTGPVRDHPDRGGDGRERGDTRVEARRD